MFFIGNSRIHVEIQKGDKDRLLELRSDFRKLAGQKLN